MFTMTCRRYTPVELSELNRLFAGALSRDPAFAAAFPRPEDQQAHAGEFVAHYAQKGEIHTFYEDGGFQAAALWSLPGALPPSPLWSQGVAEPCCKLYLLASRQKGCGDALLRFAFLRYGDTPTALICASGWQKDYFARYGYHAADAAPGGMLRMLRPGGGPDHHCRD